MLSSLLYSLLLLATPLVASPLAPRQTTRQYTIINKCPTAVNLFIAGALDSSMPVGGSVTRTLPVDAGMFYTDANGGDGDSQGTTRAGFFENFYYIVKDPSYLNIGMTVAPHGSTSSSGFCAVAECESVDCTAFPQPPTGFMVLPYRRVPTAGATIHPNFNTAKCMDVRGANFANGTPVQIYDCNGTPAQSWTIRRGSTKVQVTGTNFCLDAGTNPANGIGLKIWQCYDNLPAQQWYYTEDNRIALEGQGFCTDLTNGIQTNSNQLQTWQCTDNNVNQIWTI
ncbi:ricin B lectin domain-containing protein [Flammula alnicola]|nr:ricin B lectin domain-containing protein [Flammula alnicola]